MAKNKKKSSQTFKETFYSTKWLGKLNLSCKQ